MNVTYLLEADPAEEIRIKPDENAWREVDLAEELDAQVREEAMRGVYRKLMQRAREIRAGKGEAWGAMRNQRHGRGNFMVGYSKTRRPEKAEISTMRPALLFAACRRLAADI